MSRRTLHLDNCLTSNSAQCNGPNGAKLALFPHQKASLHAMIELEKSGSRTIDELDSEALRTRIGILGDKPGAGKSYVMLALSICGNQNTSLESFQEYRMSPYISVVRKDTKTFVKTNVIVIPHGIAKQWTEYLTQYMPDYSKYILINRKKQFSTEVVQSIVSGAYNVIVVTTTMLPLLASKFKGERNIRISRIFFDECDSIQLNSSSHIHSGFYWFVTASFHNLVMPRGGVLRLPTGESINVTGNYNSHLRIFFDAFQMVNENIIKQILVFSDEGFIDISLQLPQPILNTVLCKTPYTVRVLDGNVRESIISALNAGDVDSAVRNIGAVSDSENNIVATVLDGYRREKRALVARLAYIDDFAYQTQSQKEAEKARCISRIEQIDRSIDTITSRVTESTTCPICYEDFSAKTVVPCCQNSFCLACVSSWLTTSGTNSTCPLCKKEIHLDELLVCNESTTGMSDTVPQPDIYNVGGIDFIKHGEKLENLKRLITSTSPDRKFLIFSEYDFTLETTIARMLQEIGVKYGEIKRNINTINRVVNDFKNGGTRVLLINSSHYGCGMNLAEATDIVIMHKLKEKSSYTQVIGRAQRCKRTNALNVWKFLNENEIQIRV
jgi:SNF2 family DNA or RNA helicase